MKPFPMWVIVSRDGYAWEWSLSRTRSEAIKKWVENLSDDASERRCLWEKDRRAGWRAVRVMVSAMEAA